MPRAFLLLLILLLPACFDSNSTDIAQVWSWPTGTPASQGLDEDLLDSLTTQLGAGELGPVTSILIVRGGVLVYEEYFRGMDATQVHQIHSVTKSVGSALIGIAWDQGRIQDLQTPVLSFFPEYSVVENDSEWKRSMTLEHVLQMRTGIEWDEWDSENNTWGEQGTELWQSPDWIKYVLDQPMAAPPGTEWHYNTGASVLLSGVLRNRVGLEADAFAWSFLLSPMDVDEAYWYRGPLGVVSTGNGLMLRPRDMAKFGYLFLEGGIWPPSNERLISQEWVDASFQRHTEIGDGGYGYQWRICVSGYRGENVPIPFARGYGGQFIFVIRPLDMVIVVTAQHYEGERNHINSIFYDYLLHAADPEYGWPVTNLGAGAEEALSLSPEGAGGTIR
jgi:CubicO group peptidase (beta-lactamase class C family)